MLKGQIVRFREDFSVHYVGVQYLIEEEPSRAAISEGGNLHVPLIQWLDGKPRKGWIRTANVWDLRTLDGKRLMNELDGKTVRFNTDNLATVTHAGGRMTSLTANSGDEGVVEGVNPHDEDYLMVRFGDVYVVATERMFDVIWT